jgi:hypothetical protein
MIFKFRSDNLEPTFKKIKDYVKGKDDFFVIEIHKSKKIRSLPQNKYYWGVVVKILGSHIGYTSDEMHQILASKFLSYRKMNGEFVKSTTKLNTLEFENYLDNCRQWASGEMQVHIPLPNEITEEMYMMLNNIFERQ